MMQSQAKVIGLVLFTARALVLWGLIGATDIASL